MTRKIKSQPKRKSSGGYARGDETRLRIVETALDIFGQAGFDQTSTRAVAQRANVNLGALTYYFGNKEGLYRACAEHIANFVEERSGPLLDDIDNALRDETLLQGDLLAILRSYVDRTTEDLVTENDPQNWLLFMTRERTNPAAATDVIYRRFTRHLVGALTKLIGRIIGHSADEPETVIRTLAIVGQLTVFRRMRVGTLRALGWTDFQDKRGQLLKDVLWKQIEGGLLAPGAASESPKSAAAPRRTRRPPRAGSRPPSRRVPPA